MSFWREKKAIFLIGPPGCGKGTQAELLSKKLGFFHLVSSRAGQEYIASHQDAETLRQLEFYKAGKLFEPQWLVKVLKEKTREIFKTHQGIIYDGSPRSLFEAKHLFAFLEDLIGRANILIFEIEVSEKELEKRLTKRLICNNNPNHIFIGSEILKEGDKCPQGDGVLVKRELDQKEVFFERLAVYKKQTLPALNYLKERYNMKIINGEQAIKDVFEEIMRNLAGW